MGSSKGLVVDAGTESQAHVDLRGLFPSAAAQHTPHSFLPPCSPSTCQEKGQWECDQEPCLVDQDMINAINQGNYG